MSTVNESIAPEAGTGYVSVREEVLDAIQEKRRGGWPSESTPGHNGNLEGERALQQVEHNAITDFICSEKTHDKVARALAEQRFRARGIPLERLSAEDIFFCKIEAEAVLKTLEEVV